MLLKIEIKTKRAESDQKSQTYAENSAAIWQMQKI